MDASRTTPAVIDLAELDGPLAEAIRSAARGDRAVHLTDAGRPLAQITPIRPTTPPPTDADTSAAEAEPCDDEQARIEEDRREWDEASAAHRAMTGAYVFDPAENERVLERRRRLREEFAKLGPPEMSAVEMVREQRRDY